MMRWGLSLLLLLALAGGFIALERVSQPSDRQLAIVEVCDAVGLEEYDRAISLSEELTGPDPDGRIAAECRCWALLNRDRRDDCAALIDGILVEDQASDWVPHRVLSALVIRKRGEQGRSEQAAALATAAAAAYPEDLKMLELEIEASSRLESQAQTLARLEKRLTEAPTSLAMRVALAVTHLGRHDAEAALRVLGALAPPHGHPMTLIWFEERSRALAQDGDIEGLKAHFAAWRERGGDKIDLDARYALRLSVTHLRDPDFSDVELLRNSVAKQEQLTDPRLRWALYRRLIGVLIADAEIEAALEVYDEGATLVEFLNLSREDVARSALPELAAGSEPELSQSQVRFRLAPGSSETGTLLVSPEVGAPSDRDFEPHALTPAGEVVLSRSRAITPQRWVFRDREGRTRGSGTFWPEPGRAVEIAIEPRPVAEAASIPVVELAAPTRPADGRRRLIAIVLDCADWRLIQYLRARKELPVLEQLFARGTRAVLESSPAFTAAAMEALVWPERDQRVSFVGLIQRMGLELGGLASVGSNPLDFLGAVLPETRSVFEVVGSGEHVAANMLFSHGGIDAGRHASMIGPEGLERELPLDVMYRPLSQAERRAFPGVEGGPRQRRRIETIAAEFDTAEQIVRDGEIDFLLLRIEPLDLLTHAFFRQLLVAGQDDGRSSLLAAYRYIDARLADVHAELDADDHLVVMSDHGIRTPMEHEIDALFVVVGPGAAPGRRAPGMPHLRGVPRVFAQLLGVDTEWPDSGLARHFEPAPDAIEFVAGAQQDVVGSEEVGSPGRI